MNDDLISRSALLREFDWVNRATANKGNYEEDLRLLVKRVAEIPAEDAEIVRHAHWIYDPNAQDWGIGGFICSDCHVINNNLDASGKIHPSWFAGSKYCPQCGAIMDGDVDNFI
jgi:hypothetical protein